MEKIKNNKIIIYIIIVIVFLIFIILNYLINNKKEYETIKYDEIIEKQDTNTAVEKSKIKIHISGQTNFNGVLELEEGARIDDAINKAGGLTESADLKNINLAYELQDGQKIYIPYIGEECTNTSINGIVEEENDGKININTATQTELETLSGVGPSLALKIIEYRKENGKFKSIDELKNVSGIGESKFEEIKEKVKIK